MIHVRNVLAKANSRLTVQWAAALLASSTLVSSGLGLYRDRLLNALYYDAFPASLSAYRAAFLVPDFMFFMLVSGALAVTFIPVFNERLAAGNRKSAWELSSSLINFMALITLVASVLIMIFAEPLVNYIVAPGLSEAGRGLAVSMMRVIAVNPFLFAIATVIASMQQAISRYTFFTLAPMIYNIGIIIGIQFFTNGITLFGHQIFEGGIMGVALGVVLGSIMQLIVSSIGLIGMGFNYTFGIAWKNLGFRKVLRLLPARSVDQGVDYVNSFVEYNLASRLSDRAITAWAQASTLHMVPISLIGVAISTAAFPRMTEHLGSGRTDLFRKDVQKMLRVIIWLALPVATITYFARGYLVNFVKNGGASMISDVLGALAVAILARSIYHIAARSFYAQQDTKTPLYISLFAIGLNIILAIWFTVGLDFTVVGLAVAQSITAVVEVIILFVIMSRRIPKLFDRAFLGATSSMLAATGLMSIVTYLSVSLFQLQSSDQSFVATFPKFAMIVAISFGVYLWLSHVFKLREARPILRRIEKFLFGAPLARTFKN